MGGLHEFGNPTRGIGSDVVSSCISKESHAGNRKVVSLVSLRNPIKGNKRIRTPEPRQEVEKRGGHTTRVVWARMLSSLLDFCPFWNFWSTHPQPPAKPVTPASASIPDNMTDFRPFRPFKRERRECRMHSPAQASPGPVLAFCPCLPEAARL